jgi:hypothetical protein
MSVIADSGTPEFFRLRAIELISEIEDAAGAVGRELITIKAIQMLILAIIKDGTV